MPVPKFPKVVSLELPRLTETKKNRLYINGSDMGPLPIPSMHGIFAYICLIFMVHLGKYTIHGSYGL